MSLFANAKAAAPAKKATAKKAEAKTYIPMDGVEQFAAICAFETALKSVKTTLETDLKASGVDLMVAEGLRLQKRPESIHANEGKGTANIQIKTKASNIAISAEDQERLAEHNIPLKETDVVVETFIFNPEYASDPKIQAIIEAALGKAIKKGDLPADIIQHQSEKKVVCDGDNTLNAIFQIKDRSTVEALLPLVTCTAIKPTFSGDLDAATEVVADLLGTSSDLKAAPKPVVAKAVAKAKGQKLAA